MVTHISRSHSDEEEEERVHEIENGRHNLSGENERMFSDDADFVYDQHRNNNDSDDENLSKRSLNDEDEENDNDADEGIEN